MKSKDKKDVYMLIIVHEVDFCAWEYHFKTGEDIINLFINDYNKKMSGINNINKQLSLTETLRKSMK